MIVKIIQTEAKITFFVFIVLVFEFYFIFFFLLLILLFYTNKNQDISQIFDQKKLLCI